MYIIPNDDESQIKGAHCKLVIDFQFPDDFKRIEFHYGSDSEGLPSDINYFIKTAIVLTDNGILVDISISDEAMPSLTTRRLTTGAVGYGHGSMEAFRNAVSEWSGLVAQAIVGSCLERTSVIKRDCLRIGHHRICPGGTKFSGATADTIPSGWKWEQHARLLELINNKLPELLPGDNLLHSISLTIMISPNGEIKSGSVFIDADEFPKIITVLRDFDWPITSEGYMFKQFYLIDRCI